MCEFTNISVELKDLQSSKYQTWSNNFFAAGLINEIKFLNLQAWLDALINLMTHGVTGNTSGFGPEESRFEP